MPYFIILPLWALICILGVALLFVRKMRFMSTHLILSSTAAVLVSFVLSLAALLGSAKLVAGHSYAWISLVAYIAGIGLGLCAGGLAGIALAVRVNRRLGW